MPQHEGARMDGQFVVVSLCPDVCKSPAIPVPYPIVSYLDRSVSVSPNVRAKGVPVFHMGSRTAVVQGDEAGVGGGVLSGVNLGMCRPVIPVPQILVNGHLATHHQNTLMLMNCAGPDGPFNTIGTLKFLGPMATADVAPGGKVSASAAASAETPAESGFLDKLKQLTGGADLGKLFGMAQKAYSLAQTDWSNPGAVLGAIGGVAGMAGPGFEGLAKGAGMAQQAYGLATTDFSNPGSVMGAVTTLAGPIFNRPPMGGGASSPATPGFGGPLGGDGPVPGGLVPTGSSSDGPPPFVAPPGGGPSYSLV